LGALLTWKKRTPAFRLLMAAGAVLLVFSSLIVARALLDSLENQYRDTGLEVAPARRLSCWADRCTHEA
jgi:hypothetical protein